MSYRQSDFEPRNNDHTKITTTRIRQTVVAQAISHARRDCAFLFVYEYKDMFDNNVWAVLTKEEQHPKDSLLLCTINYEGRVESTAPCFEDAVEQERSTPA